MEADKLNKNANTSVRVNREVKEILKAHGYTVQELVDWAVRELVNVELKMDQKALDKLK